MIYSGLVQSSHGILPLIKSTIDNASSVKRDPKPSAVFLKAKLIYPHRAFDFCVVLSLFVYRVYLPEGYT